MVQRYLSSAAVILGALMLASCDSGSRDAPGATNRGSDDAPVVVVQGNGKAPAGLQGKRKGADPIVISQCRVTVIDRQDVPSQRDGVVLKILVREGDEV